MLRKLLARGGLSGKQTYELREQLKNLEDLLKGAKAEVYSGDPVADEWTRKLLAGEKLNLDLPKDYLERVKRSSKPKSVADLMGAKRGGA